MEKSDSYGAAKVEHRLSAVIAAEYLEVIGYQADDRSLARLFAGRCNVGAFICIRQELL